MSTTIQNKNYQDFKTVSSPSLGGGTIWPWMTAQMPSLCAQRSNSKRELGFRYQQHRVWKQEQWLRQEQGKKDGGNYEFQRPKSRRWCGSGSEPGDMVDYRSHQLTLSDWKRLMDCNQDLCQPTALYMKGSLHSQSLVPSLAAVQQEKCPKPDRSTLFSCLAALRKLAYVPHDTLVGPKGNLPIQNIDREKKQILNIRN